MALQLEQIGDKVRANLKAKYQAREMALAASREIIRHSANAIRAIHRGEFDTAKQLLDNAGSSLRQVIGGLANYPDVHFAGFVQDAEKEYAEAHTTYAIVAGEPFPGPDEIGVSYAAYLNGIGETVGELRRQVLDIIRRGHAGRSEEMLAAMDDIYSLLVTMDFPDSMTGGLRRTTDVARGILEKTRGDLTMALRQRDLESTLREFETRISNQ